MCQKKTPPTEADGDSSLSLTTHDVSATKPTTQTSQPWWFPVSQKSGLFAPTPPRVETGNSTRWRPGGRAGCRPRVGTAHRPRASASPGQTTPPLGGCAFHDPGAFSAHRLHDCYETSATKLTTQTSHFLSGASQKTPPTEADGVAFLVAYGHQKMSVITGWPPRTPVIC